jgi:hypothetical protein
LPITFPKVPLSQQHRPEKWKIAYIKSLGGRSYRANLVARSRHEGLLFEMNNYGRWTIESMGSWDYNNKNILELKFESLMAKYDETLERIFSHFGFSDKTIRSCLKVAAKHDINRMSEETIQNNGHIASRKTTKWMTYFDEALKEEFKDTFGDVLVKLGYEENNDW